MSADTTLTLPMFPLGSVLVPTMVLPLHVFEPRYRRMMGDCLEGGGQFGVVLIERGSEVGGGDQRSTVGTIATIVDTAVTADGRWGVLAVGTERLEVVRWLPDDPYPMAEVRPWPDGTSDDAGESSAKPVATAVATAANALRSLLSLAREMGVDGLPGELELDPDPLQAAWQLVALSPLGPLDRQSLLVSSDPVSRLERLGRLLDEEMLFLRARLDASTDGDGPPDGWLEPPPED